MYADFFEGEKCYLRRIVKKANKQKQKTAEVSIVMLTHLLWAFEDLITADRYHQKRMEELYKIAKRIENSAEDGNAVR